MKHLASALIIFTLLVLLFSFGVSQVIDCGSKVTTTVVVDQTGKSKFRTIQAAIDSVPRNINKWVKIQVNPGTYTEQVTVPIDKPCIFLQGQDSRTTTIAYDAHQSSDTSATFTAQPSNVLAKGITFKNSFNRKFMRNTYNESKVAGVLPALSARIYGDKSAFYDCAFLGVQDTLWDALGRHYFSNCYIEGSVDFIWGSGQSLYEGCTINVTGGGFITAQGKDSPKDTNGFVFSQCTVSGINGVKAYLGRAFRQYSTVIFQDTYLSDVIEPVGWHAWHYVGHERDLTYAEINCKGPGSITSKRVPWEKKLGATQLTRFSKSAFIDQDGWLAKLPL